MSIKHDIMTCGRGTARYPHSAFRLSKEVQKQGQKVGTSSVLQKFTIQFLLSVK